MAEPENEPVTRREVGLIINAVDERMRTLEQRLTVRMVVTVLGTNAAVALLYSPPVAAALAALGAGSVGALKLAAFLLR